MNTPKPIESFDLSSCLNFCKVDKKTKIIFDEKRRPFPIELINETNLDERIFSWSFPRCIKEEIEYLLNREGEFYLIGVEYTDEYGKKDIQVGITGTANYELDKYKGSIDWYYTMQRELLEETGLKIRSYKDISKSNYFREWKYGKKWICGSINSSNLEPLKRRDKINKLLEDSNLLSKKGYDDKNKKIGIIAWDKNCLNLCELLLNIEKNENLETAMKGESISKVVVIKINKNTLKSIITKIEESSKKGWSTTRTPVKKNMKVNNLGSQISYILVTKKGCPSCEEAKKTLRKKKLKYKIVGSEKGMKNVKNMQKIIKKFEKAIQKENYNYFPKIAKVSSKGNLISWKKGEYKGKKIAGNQELQLNLS